MCTINKFMQCSSKKSGSFTCSLCKSEHLLSECFRDRAVSMELEKATIQCTSPACSWEGRSGDFKVRICTANSSKEDFICKTQKHLETCQFSFIPGSLEQLPRSEMSEYKPKWCEEHDEVSGVH